MVGSSSLPVRSKELWAVRQFTEACEGEACVAGTGLEGPDARAADAGGVFPRHGGQRLQQQLGDLLQHSVAWHVVQHADGCTA